MTSRGKHHDFYMTFVILIQLTQNLHTHVYFSNHLIIAIHELIKWNRAT